MQTLVSLATRVKQTLKAQLGINGVRSFAQCGEDMVIAALMHELGIVTPYYVDIGAHDPTVLNNTFTFYRRGGNGICVDADVDICRRIAKKRPRDRVMHCAVTSGQTGELDFYVLSPSTLSTTDRRQAERLVGQSNITLQKTVTVPACPINNILSAAERMPIDLLSLDVETDMTELVSSIDLEHFMPRILCVETLEFDPHRRGKKNRRLIEFLDRHGYTLYADTYINSIFVRTAQLPFRVDSLVG